MSEHYYQSDQHHRFHHHTRRAKWLLAGLLIALPLVIGAVLFAMQFFVKPEVQPPTSAVQTSVQAPSIIVFRTPYFQFQAGKTWTEVAKETTDNKFVYRALKGPIVEHDLTIYVNPSIQQLDATRIQPVEPQPDGTLKVTEGISDHCDTTLPAGNKDREQVMNLKGVTFMCDADDTIYDVLVGKVKGTPFMDLIRPDGSTARYVISYRDLTASPSGRELREIVRSFQTR